MGVAAVGLAMCALVGITVAMHLLPLRRTSLAVRLAVALGLLVAMAIPVDGIPLAGYIRGVIGDPSMATAIIMLLGLMVLFRGVDVFDRRNLSALYLAVLIFAGAVYPLAMGLSPYDPYALGYSTWPMYAATLVAALLAWWRGLTLVALWIGLAVGMFALGALESRNLWDYLLDPFAVLIAAWWQIERVVRSLRRSHPVSSKAPAA